MHDEGRSVDEREVEDHISAHSDQTEIKKPVVEVEKNREKHPLASQYTESISRMLAFLDTQQAEGWKDISSDYRLPEAVARDIKIVGTVAEASMQMIVEKLLPASTVDKEILDQVQTATFADFQGNFIEAKSKGKKSKKEMQNSLKPAMLVDDIPAYADEGYMTTVAETAQADLLLRDLYSEFVVKVAGKLQSVMGSPVSRMNILHQLLHPEGFDKNRNITPFNYDSQLDRSRDMAQVWRVGTSQSDKFLAGDTITVYDGEDDQGSDGRKAIAYNAIKPLQGNPEYIMARGAHHESNAIYKFYAEHNKRGAAVRKTMLPVSAEKIFTLDHILQAARELEAEATGAIEETDESKEVKLGVPYSTDPKSGIRYPVGKDRKTSTENMRSAVEEFSLVKEKIAEQMREHLDEKTLANLEVNNSAPDTKSNRPHKETAAEKLEAAFAERDALKIQIDRLNAELAAARTKNETLQNDVDSLQQQTATQKDQISRLTTDLELSKGEEKFRKTTEAAEQKKKKAAEVARSKGINGQLDVLENLGNYGNSMGSRKETIDQMVVGLETLRKSLSKSSE